MLSAVECSGLKTTKAWIKQVSHNGIAWYSVLTPAVTINILFHRLRLSVE
jgi:hypothetical protein